MTQWSDVLDEMEQRLRDTEKVINRQLVSVAPFALPVDIGPLPPECRERAERIRTATFEAERRLSAALRQVGCELRDRRNDRPRPAYVDRLA